MKELDAPAFASLFQEALLKCFGYPPDRPLSEPESRHFSNELEEKTGLVVGWKSIKNYSVFVLGEQPGLRVNPSAATLDTFARYVFEAPPISEPQRRKNEVHYSYWFRYREQFGAPRPEPAPGRQRTVWGIWILAGWGLILLIFAAFLLFQDESPKGIVEDFQTVDDRQLTDRGWFVLFRDSIYWARRWEKPGQLTLFTLPGDNWPKKGEKPVIRNLLTRKIAADCFFSEVHLADFFPEENWQQAGLLLLEDTSFSGKSIRLSLSYNDFFGGYPNPPEIIIQAIASYGKGYSNLEEIVHHTLFTLGEEEQKRMISYNLKNAAVRIEKQGSRFRFLYSASPAENFSFKELAEYEFAMDPKFVGIFALKGFVDSTAVIPVGVNFFRLEGQPCK